MAVGRRRIAFRWPRCGDRELDADLPGLDLLADANLWRARIDLARHALNLDGVRPEHRLPPEELHVLADQNVDDGSLHLHVREADALCRALPELLLGRRGRASGFVAEE